jgi:hypothetical protein
LEGQTTVQVINKTTSVKNQKTSSGVENDIGERGGRSPLATASSRENGGKAGVEGERFKDSLSDDGCRSKSSMREQSTKSRQEPKRN